jgi:hypothetical protein
MTRAGAPIHRTKSQVTQGLRRSADRAGSMNGTAHNGCGFLSLKSAIGDNALK